MARFLFSSLVLCLLAALQVAAVALPGPSLPEVIPGPGMPSLASLNLTSAQIRAMPLPVEAMRLKRALAARAPEPPRWSCGDKATSYDNVEPIITCFKFLLTLGDYRCVASEGLKDTQICRVGDAVVTIYDKYNDDGGYRWELCADVAWSVIWTVDHCTRKDQTFAGWVAPYDNHVGMHAGNIRFTTLYKVPKKTG